MGLLTDIKTLITTIEGKLPALISSEVPVVDNQLENVDTLLTSIEGKTPALSSGKVPVVDGQIADITKVEDAAHTTGDKGVMLLGVRQDAAAALSGTDGDYTPLIVGAEGGLWVKLAVALTAAVHSIDVAKKSKGSVTTVHNGISASATSAEVDCRGFNSLLIHWVSDLTDKTWKLQILGAMGTGLTFVPWITSAGANNEYTTDVSGFFVVQGIPDYIEVLATKVDDGATVTCKVQPFNM